MWKKGENEEPAPETGGRVSTTPAPPPERQARASTGERATIGPSIRITGEVTGEEDLLVQGRVEGSIRLEQHAVTIGSDGRVKADVSGRSVTVEGEVTGNVTAAEQVVLRRTAKVQGDVTAPRVTIEDGASFRGGIDMSAEARPRAVKGPAPVEPAGAPVRKDAAGA